MNLEGWEMRRLITILLISSMMLLPLMILLHPTLCPHCDRGKTSCLKVCGNNCCLPYLLLNPVIPWVLLSLLSYFSFRINQELPWGYYKLLYRPPK